MNPIIAAILIPSMLLCQLFGTITHRHGLGENTSAGAHFHFPTGAIENSQQGIVEFEVKDRRAQKSNPGLVHQHPHSHNHSGRHSHHHSKTSCIDVTSCQNDFEECLRDGDFVEEIPDLSDHDNNAVYLNFDEIDWIIAIAFQFQVSNIVVFFVPATTINCCRVNCVSVYSEILKAFPSGREILRHHCALLL